MAWRSASGTPGPAHWSKALDALVTDFNASNEWGIQRQAVSHASYDGLAAALASGDDLPEALIGYTYQALDSAIPLDPYVDDPEWGLSSQEQDGHPARLLGARPLGRGANRAARTRLRRPALLQPDLG